MKRMLAAAVVAALSLTGTGAWAAESKVIQEADKTVFTVEAPCAGTVARIADGDAAGPNDTLCVLRRA